MNIRLRRNLLRIAAIGAAAAAVVALLRLTVPGTLGPLADLPPGLLGGLVGQSPELVVGFAGALAALATVLIARAASTRPPTVRSVRGLRIGTLLAAAAVALATPGGMIPVAGYAFALSVLAGVVVLAVLLVLRHPLIGTVVLAALGVGGAWVGLGLGGFELLGRMLASFGPMVPVALVALAHLGMAAALVAWMLLGGRSGSRGRGFASWVLRHRVGVTVAAALCAAPYVLARATWLTPWPLFAPAAEVLDANPAVRLTGLTLGIGMLAGAVLTLGLVSRWGERFPRWMAGLGGRAVPVGVAVLPATLVATLFTFGGVELVATSLDTPHPVADALEMTLMLPFWLWGPLLGLATWGYVMHREEQASVAADGSSGTPSAETQSRVH